MNKGFESIRKQIENGDFKSIDDYIETMKDKQKHKFLFKVSNFIDSLNLDNNLVVIKHLLKKPEICRCLSSYVKNGKIDITRLNPDYKTSTFICILQQYCNSNEIKLITYENDLDDEILEQCDDSESDNEFFEKYVDDNFKIYLREIGKIPMLKLEEEKELLLRFKYGDETAKKKLIESNLRLVISIAKNYVKSDIPILDLINEGNIGLMKAIDKYDLSKGVKLGSYATWWIRRYIEFYIVDNGKNIRLPNYMYHKIKSLKAARQDLSNKLGRSPSNEELAESLDISQKEIEFLYATDIIANPASFNAMMNDESDSEFLKVIPDENSNVEKEAEELLLQSPIEVIEELIKKSGVTDREKRILFLRYGLEDGIYRTLQKVGDIIGITSEGVRVTQNKALAKLRKVALKKLKKDELEWKDYVPAQNIDKEEFDEKLIAFELCDDFNKFDPSRIFPKFSDNTSMGTWFISNMSLILKKSRNVEQQYTAYKNDKDSQHTKLEVKDNQNSLISKNKEEDEEVDFVNCSDNNVASQLPSVSGKTNDCKQQSVGPKTASLSEADQLDLIDTKSDYLKQYESFNTSLFMPIIHKTNPTYSVTLYLKLDYLDKSISEISELPGANEETFKIALENSMLDLKKDIDAAKERAVDIAENIMLGVSKKDNM